MFNRRCLNVFVAGPGRGVRVPRSYPGPDQPALQGGLSPQETQPASTAGRTNRRRTRVHQPTSPGTSSERQGRIRESDNNKDK